MKPVERVWWKSGKLQTVRLQVSSYIIYLTFMEALKWSRRVHFPLLWLCGNKAIGTPQLVKRMPYRILNVCSRSRVKVVLPNPCVLIKTVLTCQTTDKLQRRLLHNQTICVDNYTMTIVLWL